MTMNDIKNRVFQHFYVVSEAWHLICCKMDVLTFSFSTYFSENVEKGSVAANHSDTSIEKQYVC